LQEENLPFTTAPVMLSFIPKVSQTGAGGSSPWSQLKQSCL